MTPAWLLPGELRSTGVLGMNRRNIEFIGRYNERSKFPLVDDKLKTKLLASEYAIPTPSLRFVIREQHEVAGIAQQLEGLDSFALKPAKGSGGKGILVVSDRRGSHFIKNSGALIGVADIQRHLSNTLAGLYSLGGVPDLAIIEDLIEFNSCFSGYSHEGVPDIRVIVFQGYPVMAMLRLATHASDGKANLHQGAVGVGLAMDTGRCLNAVQFGETLTRHPDTGRDLGSITLPDWREILILAASCYEMTGLGYMGTDIVLDSSRGPQMLELNARPGLAIQVANGRGLLPRLRHIEKLRERRQTSVAMRVDYAMKHFAEDASV